jgi:hypothetical protein
MLTDIDKHNITSALGPITGPKVVEMLEETHTHGSLLDLKEDDGCTVLCDGDCDDEGGE